MSISRAKGLILVLPLQAKDQASISTQRIQIKKKSYFMGRKSYSRNHKYLMGYTCCFCKAKPRHEVSIPVLPEGSEHGWELVSRHFNN